MVEEYSQTGYIVVDLIEDCKWIIYYKIRVWYSVLRVIFCCLKSRSWFGPWLGFLFMHVTAILFILIRKENIWFKGLKYNYNYLYYH